MGVGIRPPLGWRGRVRVEMRLPSHLLLGASLEGERASLLHRLLPLLRLLLPPPRLLVRVRVRVRVRVGVQG